MKFYILIAERKVVTENMEAGNLIDYKIRDVALHDQTIKLLFSVIFSLMMWVSASSFFYLPFTPVPLTMQVFTVLMSGLFLGKNWALCSQILYLTMGMAGMPVFAGYKNGLVAIAGPTGGYIISFAFAAYLTGFVYEKLGKLNRNEQNKKISLFIACLSGLLIIYLLGFLYLTFYFYNLNIYAGIKNSVLHSFKLGVVPFILFDIFKILFLFGLQNIPGLKKMIK
jgi:biotin transport system substrate-specific component